MYAVIAIFIDKTNGPHYEEISIDSYTIEQARQLKESIDPARKPIIVDENRIDEAIELNNRQL